MRLKELVKKIRSKNAGPFLLTIDIFCSEKKNFKTIIQNITKIAISKLYKIPKNQINIFPMKQLNIIKITFQDLIFKDLLKIGIFMGHPLVLF